MEKGLGYGLIVLACWALGEQAAGRLRLHRKKLKQLRSWLSYFRGKLLFEGATVEEALRESAEFVGAPFSSFFCSVAEGLGRRDGRRFVEIWESEIDENRRGFGFSEEEMNDLQRFGSQLGQLDREVQLRSIEAFDDALNTAVKKADEEIGVKEKLYRSLGVMAGCLIIILIW
ncbi:MAG: stage III sporulation protein AB [Lachnospiraceae bacterium]|nr:stage III sporulation protein AB [Lachnospiraceae bacterium]